MDPQLTSNLKAVSSKEKLGFGGEPIIYLDKWGLYDVGNYQNYTTHN